MKTQSRLLTIIPAAFVSLFMFTADSLVGVAPSAVAGFNKGSKTANTTSIDKSLKYVPDRVIVRYKDGVTAASQKAKVSGKSGLFKSFKTFKAMNDMAVLSVAEDVELVDVISQLEQDPNVLYAEPDYIVSIDATVPNDTSYSNLWGMNNTGQSGGTADVDINAPEAWDLGAGSGGDEVVVAVIDTGVDFTHPDLAANMWVNPGEIAANGIDDDGNGYIDDIHGINAVANNGVPTDSGSHGTHVAGTIAAVGNNGVGVTGVSWGAKILACRFIDGTGATSDAIQCLDYIYDLKTRASNPVNVFATNNSWGGGGYSQSLVDAIEKHRQAGILFFAAAGNDTVDNDVSPHYPSSYFKSNLVTVSATDHNDAMASFSNWGRYTSHVGAPGVSIYSTIPQAQGSYGNMSGTSMATPMTTGLAALIKQQNPAYDWKTVKNLIMAGGKEISSLNNKTATGRRIRAWDTDGTGSLTCSNQQVSTKLYPVSNTHSLQTGQQLGIAWLNINCGSGAGTVAIGTSGPSVMADITMLDDGSGYDETSGDGIYSAYWTAPVIAGTYTLTMPDSSTMTVTVSATSNTSGRYRLPVSGSYTAPVSWNYSAPIADMGYRWVDLPFSVPFNDAAPGYTRVYFNGKGVMSFNQFGALTGANGNLPSSSFGTATLIAPFWDNLDSSATNVSYVVDGTSPNRRFVVEWENSTHKETSGSVRIQAALLEGSSDVIFYYPDATFGNASFDGGASASIGLQVNANTATQLARTVSDGEIQVWKTDQGAPTANAGTDQSVSGLSTVTLQGSGTDPDNGSLSYTWVQTAGTPVTLSSNSVAQPTFVAPNANETISFYLIVADDSGREASDTVNITVSSIAENATVAFTSTAVSVNEDGGVAQLSVSRTGNTIGEVTVSYYIPAGSATAGSDYSDVSGTLTWADGDGANKTIIVTISDDQIYEGDENFRVDLHSVTGSATLAANQSLVTILDNDAVATVSLASSGNFSAAENAGTATITASRTGNASGAVTVEYQTGTGGTATAGSDFVATSGTLTWADGDTADKTFTVTISDDSAYEGDESVSVRLFSPSSNAQLGIGNGVLVITENDAAATVGFTAASYAVAENAGTVTVSVSRSGNASGVASVTYMTVAAGTATAGIDYVATSGTLNWADGDAADKSFTVTITDDSAFEDQELFRVVLNNAENMDLGTSGATVAINDNDTSATLGLTTLNYTVNESAGTASITVSRTGNSAGVASVYAGTVAAGTATADVDYIAGSTQLVWADGDVADKTFTVTISDDSEYEGDEALRIALYSPQNASLGDSGGILVILDNDAGANVGFVSSNYLVNENAGTATITVQRTGNSAGSVSVSYNTVAVGTATAGTDYTATSGVLSWADGDTADKSFSITIADDTSYEADETIRIVLHSPVGADMASGGSIATIIDDDAGATVSISSPLITSVSEGVGSVTITVQRSGSSAGVVTTKYSTVAAGNATAGTDYTVTSGTLTWADGDTADKTFSIPITDDVSIESQEAFRYSLYGITGATYGSATGYVFITDND